MLLVLGQGGTRLAVVLRLRLWSSTFAFPSGKGSGQLGALLLASWLFTGHERNMMPLPSEVHPVALLPPIKGEWGVAPTAESPRGKGPAAAFRAAGGARHPTVGCHIRR